MNNQDQALMSIPTREQTSPTKPIVNSTKMSDEYVKNSQLQASTHLVTVEALRSLIDEMATETPENFKGSETPFVIADLGCANGKNSLVTLKAIIEKVRSLNSEKPLVIYLTDTPENNFTVAMKEVSKGLEEFDNLYVHSVGKSFYEQLFPAQSVDFIMCYSSIHWVTNMPVKEKTLMHFITKENLHTEDTQKLLKVADAHWQTFVSKREKELKKGGRLVVSTVATHDELEKAEEQLMKRGVYMRQCLASILNKRNLGHLNEKLDTYVIFRQEDQYTRLFREGLTPLKLSSYRNFIFKDPLFALYEREGDKDKFAMRYAHFVKGWSEGVFKGQLQAEGVQEEVINDIFNSYYNVELPALFKEEIDDHVGDWSYNLIVIRKDF